MKRLLSEYKMFKVMIKLAPVISFFIVLAMAHTLKVLPLVLVYVVGFFIMLMVLKIVLKVLFELSAVIVGKIRYRRRAPEKTVSSVFLYFLNNIEKRSSLFLIVFVATFVLAVLTYYNFDPTSILLIPNVLKVLMLFMMITFVYGLGLVIYLYIKLTFYNAPPQSHK